MYGKPLVSGSTRELFWVDASWTSVWFVSSECAVPKVFHLSIHWACSISTENRFKLISHMPAIHGVQCSLTFYICVLLSTYPCLTLYLCTLCIYTFPFVCSFLGRYACAVPGMHHFLSITCSLAGWAFCWSGSSLFSLLLAVGFWLLPATSDVASKGQSLVCWRRPRVTFRN